MNANNEQTIQQLGLIHTAMLLGQFLFLGVVMFLNMNASSPKNQMLVTVAVIVGISSLLLASLIFLKFHSFSVLKARKKLFILPRELSLMLN